MALAKGLTAGGVIALAIGIFFLAGVIPSAMDSFFNANTANWSTTAATLWDLIPLAIVALLVLLFVPRGTKGS